ncbi:unnamed protein product [Brachionus calyciflorus]|uniref:Uncharacterized protein n=1 Tax=Brachionus calyciflorus TaxID=104777 RepID=A0A814EMX7_9BILA|nr:unnamed protein product [Brachionus calyciflorus]
MQPTSSIERLKIDSYQSTSIKSTLEKSTINCNPIISVIDASSTNAKNHDLASDRLLILNLRLNTMITIDLLVCRYILRKGQKNDFFKILLTDGYEYLVITSWD